MPNIVLASASPRRSDILNNLNIKFKKIVSNINEDIYFDNNPIELVKILAYEKAKKIVPLVDEDSIIIGADTVVVFENQILGKPKDKNEAYKYLKMLAGKIHYVYSGIAMINTKGTKFIDCGETKVYMRNYSEEEISYYINTNEPLDKAGAYGIQGIGSVLVKKIDGDYYNVVGLPITKLIKGFSELGLNYFDLSK
jgi:septum formation protein